MISPDLNIPSKSSTSTEWIAWYKELIGYGASKDEANSFFLKAWKQRGTNSANNQELRDYMQGKGVVIKADWQDIIIDTITWTPFSGLGLSFRTFSYVGIAVVAILLIIAMIALFNMARKPELYLSVPKI